MGTLKHFEGLSVPEYRLAVDSLTSQLPHLNGQVSWLSKTIPPGPGNQYPGFSVFVRRGDRPPHQYVVKHETLNAACCYYPLHDGDFLLSNGQPPTPTVCDTRLILPVWGQKIALCLIWLQLYLNKLHCDPPMKNVETEVGFAHRPGDFTTGNNFSVCLLNLSLPPSRMTATVRQALRSQGSRVQTCDGSAAMV